MWFFSGIIAQRSAWVLWYPLSTRTAHCDLESASMSEISPSSSLFYFIRLCFESRLRKMGVSVSSLFARKDRSFQISFGSTYAIVLYPCSLSFTLRYDLFSIILPQWRLAWWNITSVAYNACGCSSNWVSFCFKYAIFTTSPISKTSVWYNSGVATRITLEINDLNTDNFLKT